MRTTRVLRAVAQVKSSFLEPGAPTGLTGLLTHPSPRSALVGIYSTTLQKLQQIPESSVYRQSTEALTKHRLSIVEAVKPEGYSAWRERTQKSIEEHLEAHRQTASETEKRAEIERTLADTAALQRLADALDNIEQEPPLTAQQISEIETKIGAGLIEEVIQVAEGEQYLVDTMIDNRVWEELEEKPVEGQWTYHERDAHTPTTQAP